VTRAERAAMELALHVLRRSVRKVKPSAELDHLAHTLELAEDIETAAFPAIGTPCNVAAHTYGVPLRLLRARLALVLRAEMRAERGHPYLWWWRIKARGVTAAGPWQSPAPALNRYETARSPFEYDYRMAVPLWASAPPHGGRS
jgi:hypothetical protein